MRKQFNNFHNDSRCVSCNNQKRQNLKQQVYAYLHNNIIILCDHRLLSLHWLN